MILKVLASTYEIKAHVELMAEKISSSCYQYKFQTALIKYCFILY